MSIKHPESPPEGRIDIILKGPGDTTVGIFSQDAELLMTKRFVLAGPKGVEIRTWLPLDVRTSKGDLPVIPMLVHQSNTKQRVTFDGHKPAEAVLRRCRALGLEKTVPASLEQTAQRAFASGRDGLTLAMGGKALARARSLERTSRSPVETEPRLPPRKR